MESVYLTIPLASLFGAIIAGFMGGMIGRIGAHTATILGVGTSFVLSLYVLYQHVFAGVEPFNGTVYIWMVAEGIRFEVGFPAPCPARVPIRIRIGSGPACAC